MWFFTDGIAIEVRNRVFGWDDTADGDCGEESKRG